MNSYGFSTMIFCMSPNRSGKWAACRRELAQRGVPLGTRLVPAPGRFDDRLDRSVLRFPAQKLTRQTSVCNQFRWIAFTASGDDGRNWVAGDFAASVDHLADAVAAAGAQIHLDRLPGLY